MIWFIIADILIATVTVILTYLIFKKLNLTVNNYRDKEVVRSLGIAIVLVLAILSLINKLVFGMLIKKPLLIIVGISIILGIVGLIDDIFGTDEYRGLYGHIKALFKGKFTTGLFKAVTGLVLGIYIAFLFSDSLIELVVKALVFTLSVNLFNLLDLRPGRALKIYFFGLIILIYIGFRRFFVSEFDIYNIFLAFIAVFPAPALIYYDLREKAMLGDAGSNILGGLFGFILILFLSFNYLAFTLVILVVLHVIAEIWSFSTIIENNRLLRWFDNLGRLN